MGNKIYTIFFSMTLLVLLIPSNLRADQSLEQLKEYFKSEDKIIYVGSGESKERVLNEALNNIYRIVNIINKNDTLQTINKIEINCSYQQVSTQKKDTTLTDINTRGTRIFTLLYNNGGKRAEIKTLYNYIYKNNEAEEKKLHTVTEEIASKSIYVNCTFEDLLDELRSCNIKIHIFEVDPGFFIICEIHKDDLIKIIEKTK